MVGYRKTHHYPHGVPIPRKLPGIVGGVLALAWVFLVPGHWWRAIYILAALVVVAGLSGRLHRHYEETGQAVRIPQKSIVTEFPRGLPRPMLAARIAFFITVGMMIFLGTAPFADTTARRGIIVCVFALIGVAVWNLALEAHYVKTGIATEVDKS
jgi:hypothetical protein